MATIQVKDANGDIKYIHVSGGAGTSGDPFIQVSKDGEYIGSQITEDVFHYAVHAGIAFSAATYHATADQFICFTTPDSETYLHLLWQVSAENNCRLDIYEGVTAAAGGSDQIVYNKNRSAVDGGGASAVLAGNTATAGSVQVGIDWTGGTQINPQGEFTAKGGGALNASFEYVLEKDTSYGFHLVQLDGKDAGMTLTWFEVPHL